MRVKKIKKEDNQGAADVAVRNDYRERLKEWGGLLRLFQLESSRIGREDCSFLRGIALVLV